MNHLSSDVAVVISDLHVGDPKNARLDDFECDVEFGQLLDSTVPRGCTIVVAGDFIDFPQVLPEFAYHSLGDRIGVSEQQSVDKLKRVVEGHPKVFTAMQDFMDRGGSFVMLPGNHDIDLHWPRVQDGLRGALGRPTGREFSFVETGCLHERGIYVEHGNQYSYDNRFENWGHPILATSDGERLERPWGTLFMDLVYNDIEDAYPFINKVYPHTELARVILRSWNKTESVSPRVIAQLVLFLALKGKRFLVERIPFLGGNELDVIAEMVSPLGDLLRGVPPSRLDSIVEEVQLTISEKTESADDTDANGLLGRTTENGLLRRARELLMSEAATIVVFGHTHDQIDGNLRPLWGHDDPRRVFNTGSWIPRIVIGEQEEPHISDLTRRSKVRNIGYLLVELSDPPKGVLRGL
jgi:UDP-2,3-diacylglucosamine pyrophosphatase LpxH